MPRTSHDETLQALFDAERAARRHHDTLVKSDRAGVLAAIGAQMSALGREKNETELSLRLSSMARVLGELTGDRAVDLLIDILGSDAPDARLTAGESLSELAFDRFKEVALGVERALTRLPEHSPARGELPFVLVEVPEPGVSKLLEKMLAQKDGEAVAAAIEACAELGDPGLVKALEALTKDQRLVDIDDDEGESDTVTLGKLASEAIDMIRGPAA